MKDILSIHTNHAYTKPLGINTSKLSLYISTYNITKFITYVFLHRGWQLNLIGLNLD